MQQVVFDRTYTLDGAAISCTATRLDNGLQVLLTGGHLSHIGAVSICTPDPDAQPQTTVLPGHRDDSISVPWSRTLSRATGLACCVVCGIHYDNASREQIRSIIALTDSLLEELLACLTGQ